MGFSYLSLSDFQARTVMPAADIAAVEADTPGWFVTRLTAETASMHARLRKRYPVLPFNGPPYPEAPMNWLTKIVTFQGYQKRGYDPSDQSVAKIEKAHDTAYAEIKEAADGEAGLFDLPIADTSNSTAIGKGGPRSHSEASPFAWADEQRDRAAREDFRGRGR